MSSGAKRTHVVAHRIGVVLSGCIAISVLGFVGFLFYDHVGGFEYRLRYARDRMVQAIREQKSVTDNPRLRLYPAEYYERQRVEARDHAQAVKDAGPYSEWLDYLGGAALGWLFAAGVYAFVRALGWIVAGVFAA